MTETDAPPQERDQRPPSDREQGARSRSWRVWVAVLVTPVLSYLLVSTFVTQPFRIASASMEPTLRADDRIMVNKLAYRFGDIERGDVLVFDGTGTFGPREAEGNPLGRLFSAISPGRGESGGTDYVKRVIGIGGDRVSCCDADGRLSVNGQPVDEPYLPDGERASEVEFDIEVPDGRLWVLGDNRSDSTDSRDLLGAPGGGSVPEDRVVGRVDYRVWPADRFGDVRADRG